MSKRSFPADLAWFSRFALLFCWLVVACANDQKTINRVQPDLLEKSMFEGTWFVRQTIVDVPPTSGFAFAGQFGNMEKIRWEIREDLLVGYRSYEFLPGSDTSADHDQAQPGDQPVAEGEGKGNDPGTYKGNPIVAYPITAHVDVRRDYNPATGEQTNVVIENTVDRPWYDRDFMRVDWTSPKVTNFDFLSDALRQDAVTGSYWVDKHEPTRDAFYTVKGDDGEINYFDFTTRMFVEPDQLDSDGNGSADTPACFFLVSTPYDCAGGEIAMRTSFLKVDEAREAKYKPQVYDDNRLGQFGFFRTDRYTYDRHYGVIYDGIIHLANRHDLWQESLDDKGKEIPYAERKLRPIVYALSENYPDSLMNVTQEIAKDCDDVFKKIVSFLRNQTVAQLEADLKSQTGDTCMYCLDLNEDGHARMGDLRYNFITWVDNPQIAGPLGYGPSSANPETGRIVSAAAHIYGAGLDTYAQRAADMVRLMNGQLKDSDFLSGADVNKQLDMRRPGVDPRTLALLRSTPLSKAKVDLLGPDVAARIASIKKDGFPDLPIMSPADVQQKLAAAGMSDLVITPQMQNDYAAEFGLRSDESLAPVELEHLRTLVNDPLKLVRQQQAVRAAAERRSITLADYNDPALLGLAQEAKQKKLSGDALWQWLREQIYRAVTLHELGHTFGLLHNFGASTDALNYGPDYWKLRPKTFVLAQTGDDLLRSNCSLIDASNKSNCDAQLKGKIKEHMYSSVMDYGARFSTDIHGYQQYDYAALASGYGDIVEVFDPTIAKGMNQADRAIITKAAGFDSPVFGQLTELKHYSKYPLMFASADNLQKRKWMTRDAFLKDKEALRVPYVACYDDYVDRVWFCHRYDEGADPYEITDHYATAYETDYFFNNFARGRVGFGPFSMLQRALDRYFAPLTVAYQDGVFDLIYQTGDDYYTALSQTGMIRALNALWSVLARPQYGSYNLIDGTYQQVSLTQNLGTFSIPPGEGRSTYSRYDLKAGYNVRYRILEAGHLYEQFAVLAALTSADASRLGIGRDVVGGDLTYRIPFYLLFDQQLTQLFGSLFTEDPSGFAPRVDAKKQFLATPIDATQADGSVTGTPVKVETPWVIRTQSALAAMAYFRSNFSLDYERRCQIAIEGSGDELKPTAGYETVRYDDPITGRAFLAYRDPTDTGRWPGAEKLEALTKQAAAFAALPDGTPDQKTAKLNARAQLSQSVQDVDTLRTLFSMFAYQDI